VHFDYDDILREPVGTILERYDNGGAALVFAWAVFDWSALLFVVAAGLVGLALAERQGPLVWLPTAAGATSGIMQAEGLLRWSSSCLRSPTPSSSPSPAPSIARRSSRPFTRSTNMPASRSTSTSDRFPADGGVDALALACSTGEWFIVSDTTGLVLNSGNNGLDMYGLDNVFAATVPEPGTLGLFGVSLLGLGALRRRRKATAAP
jgi:hypothetical protein